MGTELLLSNFHFQITAKATNSLLSKSRIVQVSNDGVEIQIQPRADTKLSHRIGRTAGLIKFQNPFPKSSKPFQPQSSPVLILLIEVGHNVQQTANEGVCSCRARGTLAGGLSSEHRTAPLCVGKLLLHLHILLPEQGQVLLQLGHLLCPTSR